MSTNYSLIARAVLFLSGAALIAWGISDDYLIGGGPGFGVVQLAVVVVGALAAVCALLKMPVVSLALTSLISLLSLIHI